MAFWGIEVKPGKPYVHEYDNEKGRLHVSQATLGTGSSSKRSIVQCNVGDKKPIYMCSLLPNTVETCALNLEFEEDDQVIFSVLGPHTVHLSGFFYAENDDEDDDNSYGEDVMVTDSEDEHACVDCHSEDEDEDDIDFIDDDDLGMYSDSPVRNTGVRIEEIVDEENPSDENGMSKRAKKKKNLLNKSNDNDENRQIVVKTGTGVPVFESEDEDGFPKSAHQGKSDLQDIDNGVTAKKSHAKRKIDALGQDGESTRENEVKQKKKNNKKKKREADAGESVVTNSGGVEKSTLAENRNDSKPTSASKKEKKKKQKIQQESAATPNTEEKVKDKKGSAEEKQEKAAVKSLQVRSYPNGLVTEELAMGKPDGKKAAPGKKVSVHYIGKLKKNEKIFDSNVGRSPFKFRLGIGQVIKGWDVGVNGMRVGDKRRLTIPPAMGYGAKGCGPAIPPNSWLVFDVELVDVN